MAYSDIRSGHPTRHARKIRAVARMQKVDMAEQDWSLEYETEYANFAAFSLKYFPNLTRTELRRSYWKVGQTLGGWLPSGTNQKFDFALRSDIIADMFAREGKSARAWNPEKGSSWESWVANACKLACKDRWRPRMIDRMHSLSDRTGENGGFSEGADQLAHKMGMFASDKNSAEMAELVEKIKSILGEDFAFFAYRATHTGEETAQAFGMLPPLVCKRYAAMKALLQSKLGA